MNDQGRTAPAPPGHWLWGHVGEFRSDVLSLVTKATRDCGDVVRFRVGPWPIFLVNAPGLVREVLQVRHRIYTKETRSTRRIRLASGDSLLTSNGKWWQTQRGRMQPIFQPPCMAKLEGAMLAAIADMEARWDGFVGDGKEVDVASEMMRVAFAIAARSLFGADIGGEAEKVERALGVLLEHVYAGLQKFVNLPLWVPSKANRRFLAARQELDGIVYGIIRERRNSGRGREGGDLLSVLLAATDEGGMGSMSDAQLRDEVITLLLAGHETTANALSWTLHLLSQHAEARRKLEEEVDGRLGCRELGREALSAMPFGKAVLMESMRLYPPIWILERCAREADELGGYAVPRGASVMVCLYTLHRHPGYWDEPGAFVPGRFVGGEIPARARGAYLPFGAGPRHCIGEHFAMMEARLVLAAISRKYRLEPVSDGMVQPDPGITLRLRGGLPMRIYSRRSG